MAQGDKRWIGARRRRVTLGGRDVITEGLSDHVWTDFYHRAMTTSWPVFFASSLSVFLTLNLVFACIYWLGATPVSNARPGNLADLFFFSVETLATVGYGDMHPQSLYAHVVATAEIFIGMTLIAVMTGLIFARFSRPQARFLFARKIVIGTLDSAPALMVRLANARGNTVTEAYARLWLLVTERTAEGGRYRRFRELTLERSENPIFALSWTIFHKIDATSPLAGASADSLAAQDSLLLLTVTGYDDQSTQDLKARMTYSHADIAWRHRYRDMVTLNHGNTHIDFTRMHDVVPDENDLTL